MSAQTGEFLIELGEVGAEEGAHVAGRSLPPWARPIAQVLIVVLMTAVGLGASAPNGASISGPLWSAQLSWDFFGVGERWVYVSEGDQAVVARDAATGEVRWRNDVGGTPQSFREFGSVVALQRSETAEGVTGGVLVDVETGAQLATFEGYAVGRVGNRLISVIQNRNANDCVVAGALCSEIVALDWVTGLKAWRIPMDITVGLDLSIVDGVIDGIVTTTEAGEVRIIDVHTARVVASTTVAPGTRGRPGEGGVQPLLMADVVVAITASAGAGLVLAFDRTSMRPLWERRVPGLPDTDEPFYGHRCGGQICLARSDRTDILDSATGEPRGTIPSAWVTPYGSPPGMFFAMSMLSGPDAAESVILHSAADGSVITTLERSNLVDWVDSGGRGLVLQAGLGRTDVIVVSQIGALRTIGSVPGDRVGCSAYGTTLACATVSGELSAWRLAA